LHFFLLKWLKSPIFKHHILNNRRQILTKDTAGNVDLWEVTKASKINSFGVVSFDETVKEMFEMLSVPTWFSADSNTGALTIHLESPQCFATDIYTAELKLDTKFPDDHKVNIGEVTINTLFRNWVVGKLATLKDGPELSNNSENNDKTEKDKDKEKEKEKRKENVQETQKGKLIRLLCFRWFRKSIMLGCRAVIA